MHIATFSELGKIPQLTKSEREDLLIKHSQGDKSAKEELIVKNLRLVVKVARRFIGTTSSLDMDDLIIEGSMGLAKAIDKFKPELGYQLSTYADWYISHYIRRAIHNQDKAVRVPCHIEHEILKYAITCKNLTNSLKRKPTILEIASFLNISLEKTQKLRTYANFSSLSTEHQMFIDNSKGCPFSEEDVINEWNKTTLGKIFCNLGEKEKQVLSLRFGLLGYEVVPTLDLIGKVINLTRERVRQIQNEALEKLKMYLNRQGLQLEDFLG